MMSDTNLTPAGATCPCSPINKNPFCDPHEDDDE